MKTLKLFLLVIILHSGHSLFAMNNSITDELLNLESEIIKFKLFFDGLQQISPSQKSEIEGKVEELQMLALAIEKTIENENGLEAYTDRLEQMRNELEAAKESLQF